MRAPIELSDENYDMIMAAMKDIMFMYWHLSYDYRTIVPDIITGRFDPYIFTRVPWSEDACAEFVIDKELIVTGACIKVLCQVMDQWAVGGGKIYDSAWATELRDLVSGGLLSMRADIEEAVLLAFSGSRQFEDACDAVFRTRIMGFWRRMATV